MKIQKFQFDGGVAEDVRAAAPNQYGRSVHFDVSQKHKLIPYRDTETDGSVSAYAIGSMDLLTDSSNAEKLYALGNVSGQVYGQILEKSGDIVTSTFSTSTGGASASGTADRGSLRAYRNQGKLYFQKTSGSNTIVTSYAPATDTLTETVGTIADIAVRASARPFIHPLDDILYFGVGQTVAKLDGSTFTASAVTIPEHLEITDLVDYGPFLAILASPVDSAGEAKLFLWGRDTSIVEFDEVVTLGRGHALLMENVQGRLIIISGPDSAGDSHNINPKIVFREYAGGVPRVLKELRGDSTALILNHGKAKKDDDFYFGLLLVLENATTEMIWRCGYNQAGQFFVTPDRTISDASSPEAGLLEIIGDVLWLSDTSHNLKRTNDAASYTVTSIYETETFRSGLNETIIGASVHFEPLPSGASVVLKYRVNENTSWTTVKTYTTENGMRMDANSDEFTTKDGKEWHFRVESTGGAVILGLEAYTKPKADRPYALQLWDKLFS